METNRNKLAIFLQTGANHKKIVFFNISLLFLATLFERSTQLTASDCRSDYRRPDYTDISVHCGTKHIRLAIIFCPVIYTGYNESELIINNIINNPSCQGTIDTTGSTPLLRFSFPINATNSCGSSFVTTKSVGSGIFSDFSNIEAVNISGVVLSNDITTGTVTYNAQLKYYYSCTYPLEYVVNNTRVDVSSTSIAVKENNGTFISTLNLQLYSDLNYTDPLFIPPFGIELRTNVFVQVEATNLSTQYFVLLDRCYASISNNPTTTSLFNLFAPCATNRMTKMFVNGEMQVARFSFPAFRFTQQQNLSVSTYYLHCITRLCQIQSCSAFWQCAKRRKREAVPLTPSTNGVSKSTTITSPAIIIRADSGSEEDLSVRVSKPSNFSAGLGVAVAVLTVSCILIVVIGAVFHRQHWHKGLSRMP